MEYTTLGRTGMEVSRICLGCMSFGAPEWREWVLDEEAGHELLDRAFDLGITFFDTANLYSMGESERILGDALEGRRDRAVVATKGFFRMDDDNKLSGGLSRRALEQELEHSLDRLGLETVDLYQTHRWDPKPSTAEVMRTLDDAVRRNRIRYAGASSMWTYEFADANHTSERLGLDGFHTMQNHYNLLYREEEREMLPYCAEHDIGVIPWSPLARGYLTRPADDVEATARGQADELARGHPYFEGGGREINRRVGELADQKDATMAQIALAWVLHQDVVDAPIVGTTSLEHLEQAVAALDISLSESDQEWLEEPYEPVRVSGHE